MQLNGSLCASVQSAEQPIAARRKQSIPTLVVDPSAADGSPPTRKYTHSPSSLSVADSDGNLSNYSNHAGLWPAGATPFISGEWKFPRESSKPAATNDRAPSEHCNSLSLSNQCGQKW